MGWLHERSHLHITRTICIKQSVHLVKSETTRISTLEPLQIGHTTGQKKMHLADKFRSATGLSVGSHVSREKNSTQNLNDTIFVWLLGYQELQPVGDLDVEGKLEASGFAWV